MKATFLTVFAVLVTFTSAQGGTLTLPSCAQSCVVKFTSGSNIGGCSSSDIKCICGNSGFLSGIACCLAGQCDAADQTAATNYAIQFCGISGVTNLPTAVSCTSTASSTGTAVSSSGTTSPSAGSTTSSTPASSVTSSASSASSAASVASSASSATSASASATKNASPQNVAGVGAGIFGAAMVALL